MSPTSQMLMMAKNGSKDQRSLAFSNSTTGFLNQGHKAIDPENLKSKKVINFDDYSYSSDTHTLAQKQSTKQEKDKKELEKSEEEYLNKKCKWDCIG